MKRNLLLCVKTYQILSLKRNYLLPGAKDSKQKLMIFFVRYTNNSGIYTGISFLKMSLIWSTFSQKYIHRYISDHVCALSDLRYVLTFLF